MTSDTRTGLIAALLSGGFAAFALGTLAFVYWWPQDDGLFAHLAELVLTGARYGSEVSDIHGGYHTLLNAFLFSIFGMDVAVLRYPLVLTGVFTAMIAAFLLRFYGLMISLLGGCGTVAFGFLQFPNASASWYLLFCAFAIVFVLAECRRQWWALLLVGLLIGFALLFRHPNALLLLFGVSAYLLIHAPPLPQPTTWNRALIVSGISLMGVGVLVYSSFVFERIGFLFLVVPALLFLALLIRYRDRSVPALFPQLSVVLFGVFLGVLPMLIYQYTYGTLTEWFNHTVFLGAGISRLAFFDQLSYFEYLQTGLIAVREGEVLVGIVQTFYWAGALVLPTMLLLLFFRYRDDPRGVHPIVPIAVLYAPISLYYQIPFYLYASLSLTLVGVLLCSRIVSSWSGTVVAMGSLFCVVGFVLTSPVTSYVTERQEHVSSQIPNVSLLIAAAEHDTYLSQVQYVIDTTAAHETIFVLPLNPDLYFTTERKSALPVLGSGVWLDTLTTVPLTLSTFDEYGTLPALIVFNQASKYVTAEEDAFIAEVIASDRYEEGTTIGQLRFFHQHEEQIPENDRARN